MQDQNINLKTLKNKYLELQKALKNGEILYRFEKFGALILDRRKTSAERGMEYYVSDSIAAFIKIMVSDMSFEDVYKVLKTRGYTEHEIISRLNKILMILNFENKYIKKQNVVQRGHPVDSRAPHRAAFELTERCNLKCIYCYSESKPQVNGYEMSTEEVFEVLEKLKNAGVLQIWIGGGEPLLRKDIVTIIRKMRNLNFYIYLSTNGVLLPQNLSLAKEISYLVDEIHISLDGPTPEIHNRLRGSYNIINEALELMGKFSMEGGAKLTVGTVITKSNMDKIEEIIERAIQVGASAWVWSPLHPVGRGAKLWKEVLSKEDLIELHYKLVDIIEKYGKEIQILGYVPGVTPLNIGVKTKRCGAVNYYIDIRPNGDVYPCTYLRDKRFRLGNILHSSLEEILETPIARLLRKEIDEIPTIEVCNSCPLYLKGYCNTGCKALKYEIYGTIFGKYPFCTYGMPRSPLNSISTS